MGAKLCEMITLKNLRISWSIWVKSYYEFLSFWDRIYKTSYELCMINIFDRAPY